MIPVFQQYMVIDIETKPLPLAEVMRFEPQEYKVGHIKDVEKIRKAINEKRAAFVEGAALDSKTAFIQAIGYYDGDKSELDIIDKYEDEKGLLERFWAKFKNSYPEVTYVNHYLRYFDIPFIIQRSWKHGIQYPYSIFGYNNKITNVFIDLIDVWSCGRSYEYVSLQHLMRFFNVGDKDENIMFYQLYDTDAPAARAYLENDLRGAWQCGCKMKVINET